MPTQHRRGPWSVPEDEQLLALINNDQTPPNWVRIASLIGSRTPKQCRERYHQNLKPSLDHSPITPQEGEQIEYMVSTLGRRWAEIARHLNGRSDNTVKNWWNGSQHRRDRKIKRMSLQKQQRLVESSQADAATAYHHRPAPLVIAQQQQQQQSLSSAYLPHSPVSPTYSRQYSTETPLPSPTTPGASSADMTPPPVWGESGSYFSGSPATSPSRAAAPAAYILPPLKNIPSASAASHLPVCEPSARPLELRPASLAYRGAASYARPAAALHHEPSDASPSSYLPTAPNSPVSLPPIRPDSNQATCEGPSQASDSDPRTRLSHLLN